LPCLIPHPHPAISPSAKYTLAVSVSRLPLVRPTAPQVPFARSSIWRQEAPVLLQYCAFSRNFTHGRSKEDVTTRYCRGNGGAKHASGFERSFVSVV
jgi:hypothetical protein